MSHPSPLVSLLQQKSYQEGDFTLSSGAKSTFYLDAKQVSCDPHGIALVGKESKQHGLGKHIGGCTPGASAW